MGRLRVVLPGGSGQVGTLLARAFARDGHDVVVLSRGDPRSTSSANWRVVPWNARTVDTQWLSELDGADVVINLAGRSVNCRYTDETRREIMESRVDSTRAVASALSRCNNPPPVWLQASTATIYAHRFDAPNDDITGIVGGSEPGVPADWRFSTDVAKAWEAAALETPLPSTRIVLLRSAMVMSPDRGGIFWTLKMLAQLGLGGPAAGGQQYVSWIHEFDFVNAMRWLIEHPSLEGPVNIASPNPLTYSAFMRMLRNAVHMPLGFPATRWMLEIGALLMRSESELVLKSRRVVPTRLVKSGFAFEFPDWSDAARELVARKG
jgi:uncharacterized protein (TIGR01777 family)